MPPNVDLKKPEQCRSVWAFSLLVLVLLCAGHVRLGHAAGSGPWPDLPVRKWSWDEVRALRGGREIIEAEKYREGEYNRRWHAVHEVLGGQHISTRSRQHLASRGLGPARIAGTGAGAAEKIVGPDVLRVLLVRVSFQSNRDSTLTTIAPGGDFRLDPLANPGPLEIDPPPHNKAYFQAHLAGLTEYYRFMSGGRLEIQGTVLPAGDNASYQLSDVADYGPGAGAGWTLAGLETLVQDMIVAADEGMVADGLGNGLADYDDESLFTYVIFVHSGSDWQSDIAGDSPNDIPTFFVTLGTPVNLLGANPSGNPGRLSECSVIPETTNQDGFPGSIAAAFYHEFGHALGLPDVYNTTTGMPAVGIWDLMDSGTNLPVTMGTITDTGDTVVVAATGVLPPSLSVWCKWYLGWVETAEISAPVSSTGSYLLPAVGVPRAQYARYDAGYGDFDLAYPQAYRAGISPREFFLIENRWVPDNAAQTPFADLKFERDATSGVIQYLAGNYRGAWENSGLYDFFMPAGGLLVWHVNSDRISANLGDNTINALGDGLRLVEADGLQDIGVLDSFVRGWFGSWRDPFGGRDLDGLATGYDRLYTEQFPSSRLFDRSWSGLELSDMGRRVPRTASIMKFHASLTPVLSGFPWEVAAVDSIEAGLSGNTTGARSIKLSSLTPVSPGGEQVLVFADEAGQGADPGSFSSSLYGLRGNGQARWQSAAGMPEGSFQNLGGPVLGSPFVWRDPNDGYDIVWATTNGRVGLTQLPAGAQPSPRWTVQIADSLVGGPWSVAAGASGVRLMVAAFPDSLYLLDSAGNQSGEGVGLAGGAAEVNTIQVASSILGPFGFAQLVVVTNAGWFLLSQDAAGFAGSPVYTSFARPVAQADPTWALVPDELGYSLHVFDRQGNLGSWRIDHQGEVVAISALADLDGPLVCAPAVADLDGDGRHDVILATATRIYGVDAHGLPLAGFPVRFADLYPLADSTRVQGPLLVADGTGDGVNEVYFNTTGGHLVGLGATGNLLPRLPLRWADVGGAGLAIGGESERIMWLVSPGGYTDGFQQRMTINGRVSAYGLVPTAVGTSRTSEWLGPAGGSWRLGPEGQARGLGAMAPVSAAVEQVYLYPNPLVGEAVTVRFYSTAADEARVAVFNLEGELVAREKLVARADAINEIVILLPRVASGLYVTRLEFTGKQGRESRTMTLAIER